MRHAHHLAVAALMLVLPGCLGVQAGALYDTEQHKTEEMVGVFLEGYADAEDVLRRNGKPTYGARATTIIPFDLPVNVSLQPEINLPFGKSTWNGTFAAGPAFRPLSLHTTACVRNLGIASYGLCGHWLSEGKVGFALDASFAAWVLFADFGGIR
jgi:hypothetical protein